jgi:hypothetical protein
MPVGGMTFPSDSSKLLRFDRFCGRSMFDQVASAIQPFRIMIEP